MSDDSLTDADQPEKAPREWKFKIYHQPMGYYVVWDGNFNKCMAEGSYHVIERSAFDKVVAERDGYAKLSETLLSYAEAGEQLEKERDQLRADFQKSVAAIVKRDEEIGRLRAEVERLCR